MRPQIAIVALALITVLGTACSSGSKAASSATPPPATTPSTTPPTTPPTTPALQCTNESKPPQFTLVIKGTAFHPDCLVVRGSQTAEVANLDSIHHNWTVTGTQINVDIGPFQTSRYEAIGLAPGTYQFFCRFHKSLGMVGTLIVK